MRKQLYRMMKLGVAATLSLACSDAFAATLTDDANTIGLWHMDSLTSSVVVDDDSYSGGARGNDLTAYGTVSLVTFGHDGTGGALDFAGGSGDKIAKIGVWPTSDIGGFEIDLWFNLDSLAGGKIAYTTAFSIDLGNSGSGTTRIGLTLVGETGTWSANSAWDEIVAGQWYHLQAGLDAALNPILMLDGADVVDTISGATPNDIAYAGGWLTIGQSVNGRIDEVQLSSIPEPSALSLSIAIGLLVACRRTRR